MLSLHLVGSAAAAATILLAVATRHRRLQRVDDGIEDFAARHREVMSPFARIGTLPGERFVHPLMGALTAGSIILLRGRVGAARALVSLAAASLGAIVAHHAVKFFYPRPRPASALARGKTEAAFPSGHTADATAVVLTSAWLLVREGILPAGLALPLALLIAFVTGISRVALGWHWGTDVIGGWLAGLAVAAECVALYEGMR
jgi:membrane-associated phospholipid phosphatase